MNIDKLLQKKYRQVFSVPLMLLAGGLIIISTDSYVPKKYPPKATEAVAETGVWVEEMPEETTAEIKMTTADKSVEENPEPQKPPEDADYAVRLNMAYRYPAGEDPSDADRSIAGKAFRSLSERDADWISGIYGFAGIDPVELAKQLGKDRTAVMGKYNFEDEAQTADNPDSWVFADWSKINVRFYDGDGRTISGYSNAKEIISMASVYAYWKGIQDQESFLKYAENLWAASHRYIVQIGDIYYCEGCLEYIEPETTATDESSESETSAVGETLPAGDASHNTMPVASILKKHRQRTAASGTVIPETSPVETSPVETSPDETPPNETLPNETPPDETSPNETTSAGTSSAETSGQNEIIGPGANITTTAVMTEAQTTATPPETEDTLLDAEEKEKLMQQYSLEDIPKDWESIEGPNRDLWESVVEAYGLSVTKAVTEEATGAETLEVILCPGHVDLNVSAYIDGLDETSGLFNRDVIGNKESNMDERWKGWSKFNRLYARGLEQQDWYRAYELTISDSMYIRNPLSSAEIASYMNMLPEDTSADRKAVIRQALQSVGCIPYYWGGKPVTSDFQGNGFGSITAADKNGRVLRGLDCSGWVNWVYWSALGSRLPYESTGGLIHCGTEIKREALQPGDIIVRTGANAHVYLFLAWSDDDNMYVIHETSGTVNNVTISRYNVHWPYYRRLITD